MARPPARRVAALGARGCGLGPSRLLGTLTLAAVLPLHPWLRATLGVVHTHEVALDDAKAAPVGALIGTLPSMTHRSGLHAGLRAEYRTADLDRFGPYVAARAEVHPDGHGPPVYGAFEVGLALDVGRRRAPSSEVGDRTR